jgi:hypothetical protein
MNAPPRPPPRPPIGIGDGSLNVPLEADAGTTFASITPPVAGSVPPPPGVPFVSIRVPSLTPGGAPVELSGPPGTQLTIPGVPPTVTRWIAARALHLVILAVVALLVYLGKLPTDFLQAIFALLVGVQLPTPRARGEGPTVIATVPPVPAPSSKG